VKVLDLFSGIGGFSLGLERAGMETIAFCEIEKFPRQVLAKHWPNIPIYEDVRNVTKERLDADGIYPDVICGGFPCQDISVAGKQTGINGERSGLWSECARILGEFKPKFAVFENVTALLNGERGDWFKRVLWDISKVGYDAEWHCIPASEFSAHHHRDRAWIVCYPKELLGNGGEANRENGKREIPKLRNANCEDAMAYSYGERQQRDEETRNATEIWPRVYEQLKRCIDSDKRRAWEFEPGVGRVANGIPGRAHRLKGLGNAVVPQIPELIGRAIMSVENEQNNKTR